jgi:hypothetical protein
MSKERSDSQQLPLDFEVSARPPQLTASASGPTTAPVLVPGVSATVIHQRIWGANRVVCAESSAASLMDPNSEEITRLIRAKAKMLGW